MCKYNLSDEEFDLKIINYKINNDYIKIYFDNHIIGNYYFENKSDKNYFVNSFNLGDKVRINGTIKEANNNTIPNVFNYKKYLSSNNIKYTLNIKKIYKIKSNKNIFIRIKNYIYKRIFSIKYKTYLYAFILGDISSIDGYVYNNYRINGVTHLFALSGLHVSMFSSLIMYLLNRIKCNEKMSFIITSILLLFYSFLASFSPSILRATIFFILSSINKIHYLFIKPKHLLYITFFILIIINPLYIYNTGFLLSFIISFFILLNNENKNKSSLLYVSFISFLSSFPIIINMNYEINIIGFINNLIFIPFVSYIIFPLSLLTIIFPKISFFLNVFTNIMETISNISSRIININIIFSKINLFYILIYYLLLILMIKKYYRLKILFIVLILLLYFKPYFDNKNTVYFLDVDQGDSTLIVTNNKSILIDTGGNINGTNKMNSEIIPFFKSIGLKKIDYLILTHGDFDHMGWSIDLINNFKVNYIIFNCGNINSLEYKLINILNKKNIKYDICIKELNIDNNKLYFLQTKEYDNENDNSNVIFADINNYKFIFMGDASTTTEKEILNKYNLPDIDVFKVGHHGSKTSSGKDFINEINPKYSVISVGRNNRYGHPNKEALSNLEQSKIYRTDQNGSIMFKIKNNKLKIETCSP